MLGGEHKGKRGVLPSNYARVLTGFYLFDSILNIFFF